MFPTVLSIVAIASLLGALPPPAASGQTKASTQSASKPAPAVIVNINTASATEFEELPGVGAKTAARIVEYRQKNGPFKKIEELMNVRGLGEKNFLKLKPQLTIGAAKADHDRQEPR
jgi:competence protein ComEA